MARSKKALFDDWPERYDRWFETPAGGLVKKYETDLVMELLAPGAGQTILDAGCGTGLFTLDMLASGCSIVGLDISLPMVRRAVSKTKGTPFSAVVGDMTCLPFEDESFDKAVSITALEFIKDGKGAVDELFRVTASGGLVVVATLNSESPWAERRRKEAARRRSIFSEAVFRSPGQMCALAPLPAVVRTAVHFERDARPEDAVKLEGEGRKGDLTTGAFIAACWRKP